jgi:Inhibitor of vertebrate lysozyme (Ivy)
MRIAALLALTLIAGAARAEDAPYLFDVLPKPAYRAGWDKLMKEVQPTPDWLMQFSRNFDGVAGPMKPATIEGKTYELYFVCKPHDCAAKKFEVMFDVAAKRAYGALGGDGDPPFFYGAPTPAMQDALAAALKG